MMCTLASGMRNKSRAIGTAFVIAGVFSIIYNYLMLYEAEVKYSEEILKQYPSNYGGTPPLFGYNFWQPYVFAGIAFLAAGIMIFAVMIFRNLENDEVRSTHHK